MTDTTEMGLFDVKTHFSEVVDRVLREGRPITVTRRGKPVVEISPCADANGSRARMSKTEALATLDELRARVSKMSRDEIVDLVDEGRNRCPDS